MLCFVQHLFYAVSQLLEMKSSGRRCAVPSWKHTNRKSKRIAREIRKEKKTSATFPHAKQLLNYIQGRLCDWMGKEMFIVSRAKKNCHLFLQVNHKPGLTCFGMPGRFNLFNLSCQHSRRLPSSGGRVRNSGLLKKEKQYSRHRYYSKYFWSVKCQLNDISTKAVPF